MGAPISVFRSRGDSRRSADTQATLSQQSGSASVTPLAEEDMWGQREGGDSRRPDGTCGRKSTSHGRCCDLDRVAAIRSGGTRTGPACSRLYLGPTICLGVREVAQPSSQLRNHVGDREKRREIGHLVESIHTRTQSRRVPGWREGIGSASSRSRKALCPAYTPWSKLAGGGRLGSQPARGGSSRWGESGRLRK